LPSAYVFEGRSRQTAAFLDETETTGLIVLRRGEVVHEAYWLGNGAHSHWPSWSLVKSFVSALIGMAIDEGAIGGVHDLVTDHVPKLAGSAYEGVTLEHVLQMSSGARWNENYADPAADTYRLGQVQAYGASLDDFAASLPREYPPGIWMRYNSIDTYVLAMVLRRATKTRLFDYLRHKLWNPLGMESDGFFVVDGDGKEWAGAGLIATLRDMARLGVLYANDGQWDGRRVLPESWVRASTTPQSPHVMPGASMSSPFGYGYHWWLPDMSGAFSAIGIYNQYIWVDPKRHVVIGKSSANRRFAASYDEAGYRDLEHMALFQAIAARY
jgi:CubicO group peptidase (beta-lactamase class C family)